MSASMPTPNEDLLEYADDLHDVPPVQPKSRDEHLKDASDADASGPPSPPISPPKPAATLATINEPGAASADPILYTEPSDSRVTDNLSLFRHEPASTPLRHFRVEKVRGGSTSRYSRRGLKRKEYLRAMYRDMPEDMENTMAPPLVSTLLRHNQKTLFDETMAENANFYRLTRQPAKPSPNSTTQADPSSTDVLVTTSGSSTQPTTSTKKVKSTPNKVVKPGPRSRRAGTPIQHDGVARAKTPPTKKVADLNWEGYPDYSPPTTDLDDRDDAFTFSKWNGRVLSLDDDPQRHFLHPSEIKVAEVLRLECGRWLLTKRLIFMSALECYRAGKAFKKTDAQKASTIDVNKASKIWEAFNSVGWFESRHFERFSSS